MYRVFVLLLLAISPVSGAVLSSVFHFYVNGVDESDVLGLPSIATSRTNFELSAPVTIPGLAKVAFLKFSAIEDPDVTFFFGVQNTTNAIQSYVFPLLVSYVGGPYTTLTDSFTDSFTDGNADGAVTIGIPAGSSVIAQPVVDGFNRDGQGMGCTLTGGAGFSGSCNTGPSLTNISIPTTPAAGSFGVIVSFTLSPGDVYTSNGQVSLGTATPEPATYLFFAGGLILLWFARKLPSGYREH